MDALIKGGISLSSPVRKDLRDKWMVLLNELLKGTLHDVHDLEQLDECACPCQLQGGSDLFFSNSYCFIILSF